MDPDKLLEEIRALLEPAKNDLCRSCGVELAEKFDNLDEWISNGGFLPLCRSCLNHGVELAEKFDNLDEWISNGGFLPPEWAKGIK